MSRIFLISLRDENERLLVQSSEDGTPGAPEVEAPELRTMARQLTEAVRKLELQGRPFHQFQLPAHGAAQAGLALAEAFPEGVREALAAALGRRPVTRLDVVLELDEATRWLHDVPWELLRLPGDELPVALHETVAFYRRVAGSPVAELGGLPLRILFAVAAPDSQAHDVHTALDWEKEEELIDKAVRDAVDDAVFETADEGNLDYLAAVANSLRPHVLHLSGHGRRGALLLEDELGFEKEVDRKDLEGFLEKLPDATRLVVLSQCLSAATAEARPVAGPGGKDDEDDGSPFAHFTAAAARLRGYGVGMQLPVADVAAAWWASGFYGALSGARYSDLPAAAAAGRRRMFLENEKRKGQAPDPSQFDRSDWAAPVLYVAGGVFPLLEERPDTSVRKTPQPPSLANIDPHRDRRAFVGRRRERRELLRAVRREHRVGVVLRALGGTGKSSLAAHLVERLALLDGWRTVYFRGRLGTGDFARKLAKELIDDPGKTRAKEIRDTARALAEADEADEILDGVCDLVDLTREAGQRVVLVFDDFEQNLASGPGTIPEDPENPELTDEAASLLARLARRAGKLTDPKVLLLLTSRYPVPPPSDDVARRWLEVPVGPLGAGEQRKLWRRLASDGGRIDREAAWKQLGGHPRALEILALLEALKAHEAERAKKLEARLTEKLAGNVRAAGESADFLAQSVELASDDAGLRPLLEKLRPLETAVLEGLALFRAPFAEAAAAGVLYAVDKEKGKEAAAVWKRLTTFGLVAPARVDALLQDGRKGPELWHVPVLVRSEVAPPSTARTEIEAAAARHLGMRRETEVLGMGERLALAEATTEHAVEGREWEIGWDAAMAVLTPLYYSGEWRRARLLGERWLQRAREASCDGLRSFFVGWVTLRIAMFQRLLGDGEASGHTLEEAVRDLRKAVNLPTERKREASEIRAKLLYELSVLESAQGLYDDARQYLRESLELRKKLGDLQGYAASLHQMAVLDSNQGRFDDARQHLRESLELRKKLGDLRGYATSLHQMASLDTNQGRFDDARQHLREALVLLEKSGDLRAYAAVLHQMAILDTNQGRHDNARQHLRESLALLKKLGDLRGYAAALHQMANLDARTDHLESAERYLRESMEINQRIGADVDAAMSRVQLGQILLGRSPSEALVLLEEAVAVLRTTGRGELSQAESILQQAVVGLLKQLEPALEKATDDSSRAGIHYLCGICYRLQDRQSKARENLEASLELNRRLANPIAVRAIRYQLSRLDGSESSQPSLKEEVREALDMAESLVAERPAEAVRLLSNWQPSAPVGDEDFADAEPRLVEIGRQLRETQPGPQTDVALGEFLCELRRREGALKYLHRALSAFVRDDPRMARLTRLGIARNVEPIEGLRDVVRVLLEAEAAGESEVAERAARVAFSLVEPSMRGPVLAWVAALPGSGDVPAEMVQDLSTLAEDAEDRLFQADALARLVVTGRGDREILTSALKRVAAEVEREHWTTAMKRAEEILKEES